MVALCQAFKPQPWSKIMKRNILLNTAFIALVSSSSQVMAAEYFELKAVHSGKCAQVNGLSQDNGAKITQWQCVDQPNVLWRKINAGNGYFKLQAKHSGKCAQVNGASQNNGADITQWDCVNQNNVLWKQEPAGDTSYYIINKASDKCMQVDGISQGNGANISQWDCVNQPNVKWEITGPSQIID
jgi:hypothetical protein